MDKIRCLINMSIAFFLYPFAKGKFKGRKIWIVGGNAGELFVDNGRAIYEYIRAKKEVEEYWVINRNSPALKKIPGKKLLKGSVKSYLYFMNAQVVLFSHSISADIVPYLYVVPIIRKFHHKTLKVFLNHGTVGFKVRMAMNKKTEKIAEEMVRSYDVNICDSQYEKEIKRDKWWNIPEEKIFITGYPRYDKLYDVEMEKKEIFFMPTWRNWIRPENTSIEETDYFKNIVGLITDDTLNKYLEIKDIKLNIYIHQLMHDYFEKFNDVKLGTNVKILPKDADITKELMKSSLLVTDYSSVSYDYLYINKPIVFFQFDKNEYEQKVGSYVDLENDLFGEKAYNVKECVNEIVKIANNNYKHDDEIQEKVNKLKNKFLTYTDKENCKRVYELIIKKLEEKHEK